MLAYLDHFYVDLIGAGAAFYLNRHVSSLSVFIFTAARSFALRARGLWTISAGAARNGSLCK